MSVIESERAAGAPPVSAPRRGVFYGWWVVLACCVVATLSSGTGFYGPGLYIANISGEFGWPRGAVAGALSLYFLASGLISPTLGRFVDQHDPRNVMMLGAALFAVALVAHAFVTEIWHLYPIYLLMAMGFAMFGGVPVNTVVARWFARQRGTAMSLAVSGFSVGGFVIVPLAGAVTAGFGWRAAMYMLAALTAAVVIPLAALVIVARPQEKGLLPDGDVAPPPGVLAAVPPPDWTAAEAMRTLTFWTVVIAWVLAGLAMAGYVANQLSYLQEAGLNPAQASQVVSVTAALALVGRLSLGFLADRLPKRRVAVLFFCLQSVALATLVLVEGPAGLVVSAALFGLAMGGIGTLQPLIFAEAFGVASFGAIFGWSQLMGTIGFAIGPSFPAFVFDLTGSYRPAFMVLAGLGVLAAVTVSFARPPRKRL